MRPLTIEGHLLKIWVRDVDPVVQPCGTVRIVGVLHQAFASTQCLTSAVMKSRGLDGTDLLDAEHRNQG